MESFFARYKNALVLITVLVVLAIGLATQVRHPAGFGHADGKKIRALRYGVAWTVTPFERSFMRVGHGIRGAWANYVSLRGVKQHNADLQYEINRLRLEEASLAEDARQGQRLQTLLNFKQQYIYKTVAAQVIGTSGNDQSRVLYLDKGSADGLKPDMAVITPDGIVGKLRDVFAHSAQVLEINDQTAGAGVVLETTRIRGILRGNTAGEPQIVNLLPDERIKAGERVLTSGGDQVFPRGLIVGNVQSIAEDKDHPPYLAIVVKPTANLSRLEEVLVITETTAQLPAIAEQDLKDGEAAKEMQRAADAVAEKLPGLRDPNAPPVDPATAPAPGAMPIPVKVTPPLHPDKFTPMTAPPAAELTPGQRSTRIETPAQKTDDGTKQ